jgi:choice-of-anchor A domain-containing protein
MRHSNFVIAAIAAAAACAPASAADFTAAQYMQAQAALQAMQATNLIVTGDATLHSDVEGKVFVGGDLTGNGPIAIGNSQKSFTANANVRTLTVGGSASNIMVNNGIALGTVEIAVGGDASGVTANPGGGTAQLRVGGNLNAQNFNPNASKTALVGGTISGNQPQDAAYLTNDATLKAGGANDLKAAIKATTDALTSDLATLSQILGALTPNATLDSSDQNNIHFTFSAAADSAGYAVADITASQLQNGTFVLPIYAATQTLIVNVSGTTVNLGANPTGSADADQQHIIWNFTDATTINVNTALFGSVLAPKAVIQGNSPINGSVAARMFASNGEVHLGTFNGNSAFLATPPGDGGTGGVPEPASWLTMLLGFGVTGTILRAQRRREHIAAV